MWCVRCRVNCLRPSSPLAQAIHSTAVKHEYPAQGQAGRAPGQAPDQAHGADKKRKCLVDATRGKPYSHGYISFTARDISWIENSAKAGLGPFQRMRTLRPVAPARATGMRTAFRVSQKRCTISYCAASLLGSELVHPVIPGRVRVLAGQQQFIFLQEGQDTVHLGRDCAPLYLVEL